MKQNTNQHTKRNPGKEIPLKRFFMVFLTRTLLSLAFVCLLWVCLLLASSYSGITIPANAVEHSLSVWISTLDGHSAVTPEEVPEEVDYAFYDADGQLLQNSFDEKTLPTVAKLAAAGGQGITRRAGSRIFFCFDTDTQRIVVAYRLVARFASPLLRRLFPNAELFFFLLLFFPAGRRPDSDLLRIRPQIKQGIAEAGSRCRGDQRAEPGFYSSKNKAL